MWTVSVKAGQSELNEAMVTNEQTKERTHHVTFLNLYIDGERIGTSIPMRSTEIPPYAKLELGVTFREALYTY